MSVLTEVLNAVREVMTLTHDLKRLLDKVDKILDELRELDRRVTRLEAQWETALKLSGRKKLE
jgi:peptidoglycan hydrolase CwlO-like protein